MTTAARTLLLILGLLNVAGAGAHSGSNSFVYWSTGTPEGRLDLAAIDIAPWVPTDTALTWGDIVSQSSTLEQRIAAQLPASGRDGEPCPLQASLAGLTRYGETRYVSFTLRATCEAPERIQYNLLFAQDPLHRALVTLTSVDAEPQLQALSPGQRDLVLAPSSSNWLTFGQFGWQGMLHLWLGYDHLLFLLTLMLAVLVRKPVPTRPAWHSVKATFAVVTAFTAAHSITLILAATGTLRLPLSLVEVVIALSITLAAIHVYWPLGRLRPWVLAFGFGLIHGFGFASVLADLIPQDRLPWLPLLSFNLGLELAQLLCVVLILPLLLRVARYPLWHRVAQPATVMVVAGTGLWWAIERLPPGL